MLKLLRFSRRHRRNFATVAEALKSQTNLNRGGFTTLENGLKVATLPAYGQFCTIGVAISAGARNEVYYPPGTCHFIEKLAFSSSKNYQNKEKTLELLEKLGALIDCQSSKDTFLYASSCRISSAKEVLTVIADAVIRPHIQPDNVDMCKEVIKFENEMLARNPECEPLLTDWIHGAAFRDNTVGLSKYCRTEDVDKITHKHILTFLSQHYTPEQIVLAGVGVPQDWLVQIGEELFDERTSTWATTPDQLLDDSPPLDESLAQYTGGEIRIDRDLSQMALGPTPFPNLAHVVIGFRGVPITHPDFIPFCVLQSMMGGGGSFSAGGPGKGMYTRLYVDVLNNHHWIYNATAYNHSYSDCGLFCIRASAEPQMLGRIPSIILGEFKRLTRKDNVNADELARAKVQLKSQLMMNLEMRPVQFEDMARQIIAHGERKSALEYVEKIEQVRAEDVIRISEWMLDSKLSLVGYGDLRALPDYEYIRKLTL